MNISEVQSTTTAPLSEKEQRKQTEKEQRRQMRRYQKALLGEVRPIVGAIYTLSEIDKFDEFEEYRPPAFSEIISCMLGPEWAYLPMDYRVTQADDALRNLQTIVTELHKQIEKETQ